MTNPLTTAETARYQRHLVLPEIGFEGQQKLKDASVLIVGAGGLGSPSALYLAAAGVGTIGIVDDDVVDVTNLQRQILHSTSAVGASKVQSAGKRLGDLNPHVRVQMHQVRLSSANAKEIVKEYDIVIDGSDNFPARYLLNDSCVLLNKALVYGSIFRFEGQASLFDAARGPCYRCLYPAPPPPGLVPSCEEGGVLGVLPGIIGTIQALEAMKFLLNTGELLIGRLLLFDALAMTFTELKVRKDPACPICGEHPTIHELIDYDEFCGIKKGSAVAEAGDITSQELKERLEKKEEIFLLDVREQYEFDIFNIGGVLIPLGHLPARMNELDPEREIVVHCRTGRRSGRAVELLKSKGFSKARNLVGGLEAWKITS